MTAILGYIKERLFKEDQSEVCPFIFKKSYKMLYDLNYLVKKAGLEQRKTPSALKVLGKGNGWLSVTKNRLLKRMSSSKTAKQIIFIIYDILFKVFNREFKGSKNHNLREYLKQDSDEFIAFEFLNNLESKEYIEAFREAFNPSASTLTYLVGKDLPSELKRVKSHKFMMLALELHCQLSMYNTNDMKNISDAKLFKRVQDFSEMLRKKAEQNTLTYFTYTLEESALRNCHNELHLNNGKSIEYKPLDTLFANSNMTAIENFFKYFIYLLKKSNTIIKCDSWGDLLNHTSYVVKDKQGKPLKDKEGYDIIKNIISEKGFHNWRKGKSVMTHKNMKDWIGYFVEIEPENPKEYFGGTLQYFNDLYETALKIDVIQNESYSGNVEEKWNIIELYNNKEKRYNQLLEIVNKANYK